MTVRSPEVKIGQVWADNDKRANGRQITVVAFCTEPDATYVWARQNHARRIGAGGVREQNKPGRMTRIRVDRFVQTRQTGFTLIKDVED